jgi:CRISPR-associated protein Cpf1
MLIEKLNYLNFKERLPASPGGVLNAYQLTSKFDSFKKLGKQTGLLYYVDANYTSKICPKTGFVNLLYPKYTNLNSAIEFFNKFKSINYNEKENYFEFKFRYADFLENDQKSEYNKKEWTICSFGKRFITIRNNSTKTFETSELNLTDELRKLFSKNNISFEDCRNIKEQICSKTDKDFFERLLYLFRSTLQLRNTNSKNEEDFILSCVKDESGDFFDSRKAKNDEPKNSDANGAYHIGLKGLLTIKKIKNGEENIRVDKNEYLDFVINKKLKNGR